MKFSHFLKRCLPGYCGIRCVGCRRSTYFRTPPSSALAPNPSFTPGKHLLRLSSFAFVLACAAGCKKDEPAPIVVDAGPPPVVVIDSGPAELAPLDQVDAGVDAAVDAGPAKRTGPVMNINQSRAKQCCNAMRAQAKSLGASPEAGMLTSLAMMCDSVAAQVGPTAGGQAPELAPLRAMLKGKTVPPVCQGL